MLNRRRFLQTTMAGTAMVSGLDRLVFANTSGDARFILVILRGGMDGLAAVPAYTESAYGQLRGSLALGPPGTSGSVLDLDGFFGLHPKLTYLHSLYKQKELLVAHAVASSYRDRSHFDGQKQLENGSNSPLGAQDGWLNRALSQMPSSRMDAIALSQNIPLILYGDAKVNSWSPSVLPEADADTITRIAKMYEGDSFFSSQFESALRTRAMAEDLNDGGRNRGRRVRGNQNMEVSVKAAGRFLKDIDGPRIAVLESSGWDTHANQGAGNGQLANKFAQLDTGLNLLKRELGGVWKNTVVIVASEFGRTVAVNGSNGTDHGTANAVFILGGAVNGGKVISDWPGIARSKLYEGRDLKPTMDIRSLFKSLLHGHLQVASQSLEKIIFPNSNKARKIPDLLVS